MTDRTPITNGGRSSEDNVFLLLLIVVSLAFGWILFPFYGAAFWAAIVAMLFAPLNRRLYGLFRNSRTFAALATLIIVLILVILPLGLLAGSLLQEAYDLYDSLKAGELDAAGHLQEIFNSLPPWVGTSLNSFGLGNGAALQSRLSESLAKGSQFFATQAFSVGQNAFDFIVAFFVMTYMLFFFLRDGGSLAKRIGQAVPLHPDKRARLARKLTAVIRATVKGNIVVALVQGGLGGLIFWILGIHAPILWGVLMAFLSLLPAIGAALVWAPTALYLLAIGETWRGLTLIAYGMLVIGLIDNILRPILVGQDTRMPDYVVLIATLGGIAVFGLNGFVIGPLIAAMFIAVWDIFGASADSNSEPRS